MTPPMACPLICDILFKKEDTEYTEGIRYDLYDFTIHKCEIDLCEIKCYWQSSYKECTTILFKAGDTCMIYMDFETFLRTLHAARKNMQREAILTYNN